jgi:hypothetical protein
MPTFKKGGKYKFKIVPSGYEFLGPGNEVGFNVPRNFNDVVAKYHDIDYRELSKRGNPYISWSEADAGFLQGLQPNDGPTWFAKAWFEAKKLGMKAGIVPELKGTSF